MAAPERENTHITLPGVDRTTALAAVIATHRLFDGFFRGKVYLTEKITQTAVTGRRLRLSEVNPGDPDQFAHPPADESATLLADRDAHLVAAVPLVFLDTILRTCRPATVTVVSDDRNSVTVHLSLRRDPGVDWSILEAAMIAIRAFAEAPATGVDLDRLSGELAHLEAPASPSEPENPPDLFVKRFHDNVDDFPDRTAVTFRGDRLTYGQLADGADSLARALMERGLRKGSRIMILGARKPRLAALLIAAFKVGVAVCLVDPRHPDPYLRECADAVRPDLVADLAGRRPRGLPVAVVSGAELSSTPRAGSTGRFRSDVLAPDDCAIITLTSGTSGTPKAVAGRYSSLTCFFDWMDERLGPLAGRVFGMCSSLGHDPIQRDIMTPLYLGGQVAIPDDGAFDSPDALCGWLTAANVEVVCVNPVLTAVIARPDLRLPRLSLVFTVGAALTRDHVAAIRAAVPKARIVNLYGSTETQRAVSYYEIPTDGGAINDLPAVIPLGRGMKDVDVTVVPASHRGRVLPFQQGEIAVRSGHIALGYLNSPRLSAARFGRTTPGRGEPVPVYWTGDLGYRSPKYGVVFLGRADDQHKINGHRIEPEHVNAVCRRHPDVRDAATVVLTEGTMTTMVTFLAVATPTTALDPVSFRSFLARRLPAYMIPHRVEPVAALPLTLNNKVDVERLREIAGESSAHHATGDDLTGRIQDFVRRHSRAREVPLDVPLRELGIDSLRLMLLVGMLGGRRPTRAPSDPPALTTSLTVGEIVARLEARTSAADHVSDAPETPAERRVPVPRPLDILGPVVEVSETTIRYRRAKLDHLCSNSYLGLNSDQRLREKIARFVRDGGSIGAHGSAELNGFTLWHERLVEELSALLGGDAVILHSSGYLANVSTIPALAGPGDDIFVDASCHKSIMDGCLLSGSRVHLYRHNDSQDLEALLGRVGTGRRVVVTEGVFSVGGDVLGLPAFAAVARGNGCLLVVDESCSLGQLGVTGRGVEEHFDMAGTVDVKVGTLSKALVANGGYAVCRAEVAERLRFQRGETFSTALSPLQAFIAAQSAHILHNQGAHLMSRLTRNASTWRTELREAGFDIGSTASAIVPIHCVDADQVRRRFAGALQAGAYCLPIGPPWSRNSFALRTSVTAAHDPVALPPIATRLREHLLEEEEGAS